MQSDKPFTALARAKFGSDFLNRFEVAEVRREGGRTTIFAHTTSGMAWAQRASHLWLVGGAGAVALPKGRDAHRLARHPLGREAEGRAGLRLRGE